MTIPTPAPDAGRSPGPSGPAGPAPEPFHDLVEHARETHVVVIGGGIAGLVAAWECAKVGMAVTLVEASDRLGGTIGSARIAGLELETGVTCWSTRGGTVRGLVDEVLPDAAIVRPRDDREWIAGLPKGAAAPLPAEQVLGIPANPWDESVRRIIGWGGTWRAYVDRLRPPLTIGAQRSLGRLVHGRMGDKVLDRLVAPLTIDRFGLDPVDVDVEVAAPGLSNALTRTGWLGGAVADVRVDAPSATIEGLDGGMPQLAAALADRLAEREVAIHTGALATGLVRSDRRWTVELATIAPEGAAPAPDRLDADAVIVATDETTARALLAAALGTPAFADVAAAGIARDVVTLVVDAPELDGAPRGAHVHAVPGASRATGLVHETARWEWLARDAGAGRHVVRVAFGAPGIAPATEGLSDADAAVMAVAEASVLLGVQLDEGRIAGAHRDAYTLVPPASTLGRRERTDAARAAIVRAPGLAAIGAWLSGSGLAQVVADAQEEADRLRHKALWGAKAAE
ncbi:protoporphyrinogen/coproporphyrinogen oxidase [Microbacterium sp. NPDC058062]|uniref:protoporphyrinogen/coproporphyrinogen oxidase n=1 Tax=Microbacterium sp. NPDC058062 TaxID=3346320 RepID=UPI0036DD08F5